MQAHHWEMLALKHKIHIFRAMGLCLGFGCQNVLAQEVLPPKCAFDYDVTRSALGFPAYIEERAEGVKKWTYQNGTILYFESRHLVSVVKNNDDVLPAFTGCTKDQIDRAAKEKLAFVESDPVIQKPIVAASLASAPTKPPKKPGVRIGMTPKQVLASSWGAPEDVNRTTTIAGTSEQWVYGGRNYLYFRNGLLVAIQN